MQCKRELLSPYSVVTISEWPCNANETSLMPMDGIISREVIEYSIERYVVEILYRELKILRKISRVPEHSLKIYLHACNSLTQIM